MHDGAVLSFLERLEVAGDITLADRELIASHWHNEQRAETSAEAEYWALRLVCDLARALGADDHHSLQTPLRAAEDALVRALTASLTPR